MSMALTLDQLPSPPVGKTGWPWTEASAPLPATQPNGSPWPRISVVTPSYNQGQFLEETLRSVLLQGYPNLDYIVIDGGSQDESVDILQKYSPHLAYWVSEPDRGQSHALNKGIQQITGSLFTFVNSDDFLMPKTLSKVAQHFVDHANTGVVSGGVKQVSQEGHLLRELTGLPVVAWQEIVLAKNYLPQLGTIWRSDFFKSVGVFREDLHYFFDQEFFVRLLQQAKLDVLDPVLAAARFHEEAKSFSSNLTYSREKRDVQLAFLPKVACDRVTKFLAYRLICLSYLIDAAAIDPSPNFFKKLKLILSTPLVWTSPKSIKRILLRDNHHTPIRGLNAEG